METAVALVFPRQEPLLLLDLGHQQDVDGLFFQAKQDRARTVSGVALTRRQDSCIEGRVYRRLKNSPERALAPQRNSWFPRCGARSGLFLLREFDNVCTVYRGEEKKSAIYTQYVIDTTPASFTMKSQGTGCIDLLCGTSGYGKKEARQPSSKTLRRSHGLLF